MRFGCFPLTPALRAATVSLGERENLSPLGANGTRWAGHVRMGDSSAASPSPLALRVATVSLGERENRSARFRQSGASRLVAARVAVFPAHEPPVRSRRGKEADFLGRQHFPPHYFGGYEVQRCRASRWFSGNSLPEGEGEDEAPPPLLPL